MKMTKVNQNRNKNILEQNRKRAQELKIFSSVNFCTYIFCSFALLFFMGCNSDNQIKKLNTQIDNLKKDNAQLTKEVEQIQSKNKDLESQMAVLQELPENVKGENLYILENVKIHNYSTLYDENKDGEIDTLIVRIQPIDNFGDLIKASGSVDVELWNLNKPENQAQIGKWQISPDELKKLWNDTLVTNYRLSFDVSGKIEKFDSPHTLKVIFTDYLSGKTFNEQKVLEP